LNILLTRPLSQVKSLEAMVHEVGDNPLLFPTLTINPLSSKPKLKKYDAVIFISANAVDYAFDELNSIEYDQLFTVGAATAKRLKDRDIVVDDYPKQNASSEALLALPRIAELIHKKILIFRGKGGRETLKNGLEANHNQVEYIEAYERVVCNNSPLHETSLSEFLSNPKGVISITSNESMDGLLSLVENVNELINYPVIVLSNRIKSYVESFGFSQVLVTPVMGDKGIIEVLATINKLDK